MSNTNNREKFFDKDTNSDGLRFETNYQFVAHSQSFVHFPDFVLTYLRIRIFPIHYLKFKRRP